MEYDIYRVLRIPSDSTFCEIHNKYKDAKYAGLYEKEIIQSCYRDYCRKHIDEVVWFYWEKGRLTWKVLFGSVMAIFTLYSSYAEGFQSNEQIVAILLSSMYLFCSGWGIEVLTMIQLRKLNKIPFVGIQLYIILKLGIGIAIGGLVVLVRFILWVWKRHNFRRK